MKYFMLIADGMADDPSPSTPLERARTPHMDSLMAQGELGRALTVPAHMSPGSDVAILGILGYDPARYYTGRGPLEAVGLGVTPKEGQVVFRCNLVTLDGDTMVDYSAGGLSAEEGEKMAIALQETLGTADVTFVPGVGYRHLLVMQDTENLLRQVEATPPHSITGKPFSKYLPQGPGAKPLLDLMDAAKKVLASHPVNAHRMSQGLRAATSIWPWSGGVRTALPSFESLWGLKAGVVSAVALVKSIGLLAGMKVFEVEGATGYLDSNLKGKVDAALGFMEKEGDFVVVHVEAPDEAGHHGDAEEKREAIERFDRDVVGGLLKGSEGWDRRFLIVSDHRTPVAVGDHTSEWVPWLISSSPTVSSGCTFSETACAEAPMIESGPELLSHFLERTHGVNP